MYVTMHRLVFSIVCAGSLSVSAVAGDWMQAAEMNQTRQYPGLARLPDGRILAVTGHPLGGKSLASAETFDPVNSKWNPAGTMTVASWNHRALRLHDGRVLVVGGASSESGAGDILAEAEIFDLKTNTWSVVSPMRQARRALGAVVLADGRVLVVGGKSATKTALAGCEFYDPMSNRWTDAGSLAEARWGPSVSLLSNGEVLAVGGMLGRFGRSKSTEIF